VLTPDERRGAIMLLALLLIGVGWDAARLARPPGPAPAAPPPIASPVESDAPVPAAPANRPVADSAAVDLNRATPAELEALPGIGPVLARRIADHRAAEGPFRSVEELRAVRGVGPRLMERLRGRIRVSGAPQE
jgi:competence protein ComEA